MLAEVPFCWVGSDPQFSLRNTNPMWAFILRSKETRAREKNRSCVLAWSIGNSTGTVTSKDISFRSSKRNVLWIALSGGAKYGLVALGSGKPLHTRSRVETNGTMLFLSPAIGVPSDYSSNATPGYDIRLTPDNPIEGAFRLRVTANKP